MHGLINALEFLGNVHHFGAAIIAGGCARDAYFHRIPKDFDIMVPKGFPMNALKEAYRDSLRGQFTMYDSTDPDTADRVIDVLKFSFKGTDIDVIRYNVEYAEDCPNHFDANLNQFVLGTDGVPRFVGTQHPDKGLKFIREVRQTRQEYIENKYADIYLLTGDESAF